MGEFSAWHVLIIAAVFVLLFGYKKLPDATRSLGRSLRIFKAETRGLREDGETEPARAVEAAPVTSSQPVATAQPVATSQPVTTTQPLMTTQPVATPVPAPAGEPQRDAVESPRS